MNFHFEQFKQKHSPTTDS